MFQFIKDALSEDDGKGSLSRMGTAALIAACIFWDTHLVFHNNALPDFGGQTLFIATLYGLNQASRIVGDKMQGTQKKFLDDLTAASATPTPGAPAGRALP
jgi:Na+/citrate or Na+/malate symporter